MTDINTALEAAVAAQEEVERVHGEAEILEMSKPDLAKWLQAISRLLVTQATLIESLSVALRESELEKLRLQGWNDDD